MSDLKPCPFCGGVESLNVREIHTCGRYCADMYCIECRRCLYCTMNFDTKDELYAFWNTRPAEGANDKEIERLKEALRKIAYIRGLNPELKATEFSVDAETELKNFYCTMGDIAKMAIGKED